MERITIESERKSDILQALARYKYLTTSQLIDLGLTSGSNDKSYLNKLLNSMRSGRKAVVGCIMFSGTYKFQQREYVYYLTPKGEEDLILKLKIDAEDIRRPVGTSSMYDKDYMHRKYFIDVQISLYKWADKRGYNVPLYDTYYDFEGSSRKRTLRAKTSILLDPITKKRVVPDGLFFLDKEEGRSLFAVEMHMGNDTGRAMDQIKNHKKTLDIGSASTRYDFNKGNRILYIFENEAIMASTMQRVCTSPTVTEAYHKYFLFASYKDLRGDFDRWLNCYGEHVKL